MKIPSLVDQEIVFEPQVSIIIPTWRDSRVLQKCLRTLEKLEYPKTHIEVILVSRDVIVFQEPSQLNIKIIKTEPTLNHAQMRNEAVEASQGEILIFIDDDVEVKADWLRNGLKYFLLPNIGVIGGPGVLGNNAPFIKKIAYYTHASPFSAGFTYMRYFNTGCVYEAHENDLILCNCMIRRKAFLAVGGFRPDLVPCEENDLFQRILDMGWKLFYVSEIEVYHWVKRPLVLVRKTFWYGVGRGAFIIRNPAANKKPRIYIPSLSVLVLLFGGIFAPYSSFVQFLLFVYLALYAFNIFQHLLFVYVKFNKNPLLWIILPPITFLFQHSYGLGVLTGLVKALFFRQSESKMNPCFQKH